MLNRHNLQLAVWLILEIASQMVTMMLCSKTTFNLGFKYILSTRGQWNLG